MCISIKKHRGCARYPQPEYTQACSWNNLNSHLSSDYRHRLKYNGLPIVRLRDENGVSLPIHDAPSSIELSVSRHASSSHVEISRVQDQLTTARMNPLCIETSADLPVWSKSTGYGSLSGNWRADQGGIVQCYVGVLWPEKYIRRL